MKKTIFLIFTVFFVGCLNVNVKRVSNNETDSNGINSIVENNNKTDKTGILKKLTYSNIADGESREKVSEALKGAGVSEKNINLFLKSTAVFNESVEGKGLIKKGFITSDDIKPEYSEEIFQTLWEKNNPYFPGYNCRITAYSIMREFLSSYILKSVNTEILFMDMESLENDPLKLFTEDEKGIYRTIFSSIDTENSKDRNVHFKRIKKEWSRRGVKFKNNEKMSMISVFFHSQTNPEENMLFIGHVGVLVNTEDEKFIFIEKLAFQEPYQAIKFENKEQVKEYLLNRYDTEWGQPTANPFIMENDRLM